MTIRSEQVVMWDCDETLVMHYEEDKILDIVCPYDGKFIAVAIHQKHVQLLKDHKARGFYNVVWSAHGFAWADPMLIFVCLKVVNLLMTYQQMKY